jgi:hypothetical protein
VRLKQTALALATALVAVNIWTGAPLFAVWVGSRIQRSSSSGLSMGAVFAVIVLLALLEIALTLTLTRLGAVYDELTGRPLAARRTSPWLRSMRGEREDVARRRHGISALERIVVISVVAAVMAFEVWFFFFAGSSLPNAG